MKPSVATAGGEKREAVKGLPFGFMIPKSTTFGYERE
jgi:hypothetical protein